MADINPPGLPHASEVDLRVADAFERGPELRILVDGRPLRAYEGETVAVALLAAGIRRLRTTPALGEGRGPYCGMGVCFECLLIVDGQPNVRSCQEPVREGMRVQTQVGLGGVEVPR